MPGSFTWPKADLPALVFGTYNPNTSDATAKYNCIAWAAEDVTTKYWPDPFGIGKWFPGVPRIATVETFIQGFGTLGYVECDNGDLEDGFEKVAIFAKPAAFGLLPTHAARQLESGHWTSKLGDFEDVEHFKLISVSGPQYGTPVKFLRRARKRDVAT